MSFKKILLLVLFFFSISLFVPKISKAIDLKETLISENSIIVKIQEGIAYFFAFGTDNKVAVLEKQAEKRLTWAQSYADKGSNDKVQNLLQNYLQIKGRQNILLGKTDDGKVLGDVEERTIEQQKTMEEIKNKIDVDGQQDVMQVQEQVVNQVAERVVEINGAEGQTEFFNKVEIVWAPGTGPGGTAGVVYEGGSRLIFAPGTSSGGSATNDIKTVVIEGGSGGSGGTTVVGGNEGTAPGTSTGGSSGQTVVEGQQP